MHDFDIAEFWDVTLRLVVAALAGGALGVNRELHHKPAGLRTLSLVSLGSALVVLACWKSMSDQLGLVPEGIMRVVQGLFAGIGFLGAGVILRSSDGQQVHGVTTAASIWIAAGLGVACGIGQWTVTAAALVVALVILTVGVQIEKLVLRWVPRPKPDEKRQKL